MTIGIKRYEKYSYQRLSVKRYEAFLLEISAAVSAPLSGLACGCVTWLSLLQWLLKIPHKTALRP